MLHRELWLLYPPPWGETHSGIQISSQLSKIIDITDVKSVSWSKRLEHRNIICYPPVFHQMTSLISVVPDRAVFVVTVYVCVCLCVRVRLCSHSCLFCLLNLFVYLRVPAHLFVCCACTFDTVQASSFRFSPVWSRHQRLIYHFFKSF